MKELGRASRQGREPRKCLGFSYSFTAFPSAEIRRLLPVRSRRVALGVFIQLAMLSSRKVSVC